MGFVKVLLFTDKQYLSLHILSVKFLVHIRSWHVVFNGQTRVSDLNRKTCKKQQK